MYKFEKLTVWQESLILVKSGYEVARQLPRIELSVLADQLRRAVTSIPTNIAEGCGAESDKEFLRYLHIAKKSLYETVSLLKLVELEYTMIPLEYVYMQTDKTGKLLNGLIKSLKS